MRAVTRLLPSSGFRFASFVLGVLGACAALPACGSTVNSETGGGGQGGSPSTGGATTTSTGGATTTSTGGAPDTTSVGGTGGTGGAGPGGGGAGGAPDPWAGPVESLKELDLGPIDFGASALFPIPDKTLGFTVQAEGDGPTSVVGVYRLRPPIGSSVIINFAMTGHDTQVFGGLHHITAANPQADSVDAYPVKAGTWRLTLGSDGESGTGAHTRVWVRRTSDGAFHGGVVDVNLFIVQGVASQSYMNQVLDAFFPYAGLSKGTVNVYSADPSFSTVNTRDEYREMLKATGGIGDAPAINLFVVDDFSDGDFGGAIGVAGGVPGSPMRHGTGQSGLAYEPSGDPGYDATVLMHEVGHLGGLFHTTEFQIVETDPLSDTASCPNDTIQSNPAACPDKDNVMFPMAYGATAFSGAQTLVLQGSALYRGVLEAGGVPSPPLLFPVAGAMAPSPFVEDASIAQDEGIRTMPRSPDPLERALGALWCSGSFAERALSVARDPAVALARKSAGSAVARLRAVALDPAAPVLLRKRALGLYVQAAKEAGSLPAALETAISLAGARSAASVADRRLASAALRLLRDARPSAPAPLAGRIDGVLSGAVSSGVAFVAAAAAGK